MSDLHIYCDGGSRGNPGPAGVGIVAYEIDKGNKRVIEEKAIFLDHKSNNYAEYVALLNSLRMAEKFKYKKVLVHSDSKLVVEQVNGRWKVKSPDLNRLHAAAIQLIARLAEAGKDVNLKWVPRENNKHADSLANLAMDRSAPLERTKLRTDHVLEIYRACTGDPEVTLVPPHVHEAITAVLETI